MIQKISNIGTFASGLIAILCLLGLFYTTWTFSTIFKGFFCSGTLFLALFFVRNWKYNRLALLFALISFVLTCISIVSVDLFTSLKSTVFTCLTSLLAGSIIGYFQYHAASKIIQLIGIVAAGISLIALNILIWINNTSAIVYTIGILALGLLTIALLINTIMQLLKK